MHDAFRETLEKLPDERTDEDIELILENIQHLPVSYTLTVAVTLPISQSLPQVVGTISSEVV